MSSGRIQIRTVRARARAVAIRVAGELRSAVCEQVSALWLEERVRSHVVVAVGVIAAHALVLGPILFGTSRVYVKRTHLGADSVIHRIILEVASRRSARGSPRLSAPLLRTMGVDALALSRVRRPAPPSAQASAGQPGLAVLYGRYLGQIQARIERAWLRPRTAIGADLFRCRVRIDQRRDGRVGDITLQRCNGTMQWQGSLVRAIEDASPLSAPANPAVFTPHVVLEFRSTAYTPSAPAGLFEPAPPPAVLRARATAAALTEIHAMRHRSVGTLRGPAVIELDITGSQVHVLTRRDPPSHRGLRLITGRAVHDHGSSIHYR